MADSEFKTIKIEDIKFDLRNPRYDGLTSQLEALSQIVDDQGLKLVRLARDIGEHGINPSKLLLVEPDGKGGYASLEGNRRLAALKLLNQPELRAAAGLNDGIARRFKKFSQIGEGRIPKALRCVVMSREDAEHWILLEHTGQNKGAGVVPWDGGQTDRFKGGSATLTAISLLAPHLDPDTVDELMTEGSTTLRRLLHTPEVQAILGFEIEGPEFRLGPKPGLSLARLVAAAEEIADGTKDSRDLNVVAQRVAYAKEVAQRVTAPLAEKSSGGSSKKKPSTKPPAKKGGGSRTPLHRKSIIPKACKLRVSPPRLNRIYDELQRIRLDKGFVNSAAVLLRVFVELSVDEYGSRHRVSLKEKSKPGKGQPKELSLRKKLLAVADHLETGGVAERSQLQGIRNISGNRNNSLSVDSWNGYVHNQHIHPDQRTLTEIWDSIEPFMTAIWKK